MLNGILVSRGIAIEKPYIHIERNLQLDTSLIAHEDIQTEKDRVCKAVIETKKQLEGLRSHTSVNIGEEEAKIFDAHIAMLEDPMLQSAIMANIENLNRAEAAVDEARKSMAALFENIPDPYIKARVADINDVAKRLVNNLLGLEGKSLGDIREPVIVVARDLSPSETVMMSDMVKGIITETGSETSHAAIMAKAMGLPAMVGVENAVSELEKANLIILDAIDGKITSNPDAQTIEAYREKLRLLENENRRLESLKDLEAVTRDGRVIKLYGNIGSAKEAQYVKKYGGSGIGLVRTELIYMESSRFPSEDEQFGLYKEIVENGGEEIIIRTLDIGGDKTLPYYTFDNEANPFLGFRAIRFCLANREVFKTQLRAILRASAFGNAKIMFPMISSYEELTEAKKLLEECKRELEARGADFNKSIPVGIMVEIPAAAAIADILIQEADFFSIGTNDLCQYTLAVDRMNKNVADLYQPLHPAMLRTIRLVCEAALSSKKSVGMCGELAGNPLAAMALVGLGLDELSMSAASIPKVKEIIRSITYKESRELAEELLKCKTSGEIKTILKRRYDNVDQGRAY